MKVFFAFFTFLILNQGITAQEARQIQLTNNTLTGQNYIGNASVNVTNNYVEPTKNAEFFAKEYARLAAIKREAEAAIEESRLMEAEAKALMREAKGRELKAKLAEEKSRAAESQRASTLEKVRKERQNLESNRQKLQQESQRIIAEFNRAVAKNEQREKDSLNETNDATQSDNKDELQSITSTIEQQMEQVRENFQETVATIEKLSTDFEVYEVEDQQGNKSLGFSIEEIQKDPNYVFVGELIDGIRVAKKFNKFGALNARGETIIDYQYDYFEPFRDGVAVVSKFGEWKLIDRENQTVREFTAATRVRTLDNRYRTIQYSSSTQLENLAGEVVLDLLGYKSLRPFGTTDLWVVKKGGYGIIDPQGKIILETKYSEIGKLREDGYADLKQSSKYGLIDNQGGVVIAPVSGARVSPPVNGLAKIKDYDGDYSNIGLYSVEKGVLLEPQYNEIDLVDEDRNFAIVGKQGKYGVFDTRAGVFKYPVAFKNIEETTQGNYWLERLHEYQLVNQAFSPIFKKPFEDVEKLSNENVYIIELDYKYGVVNEAGEFLVKPAYSKIEAIFRDKKLVGYKVEKKVKKEALWGLLNETGEILVKPTFDEIEDFNEKGLAIVESASKHGVFTDEGGLIVPVDYRRVEIIKQDEVILTELDYQVNGLYDFAGQVVLPAEYKEITISKGLVITKNEEDEKEIYQRNGKYFLLGKYDCINFVENFILAHKKDDLETLVFDLSGSHLFSFSNGCYFELAKSPLPGYYRLEEKYGYSRKEYIDVKKKNHQPFFKSTYNKLKQLGQGVYRFERSYSEIYAKDTSSNIIVGPYQDMESLGNGYLKVRKDKRIKYGGNHKLWGVISTTDEKIAESIYNSIEEFKSGLFFASKGDYTKKHHGAFNLNGAEVIPFCFDKVSFTDLNLVEATKGEEVFLVNPDGTCASNCEKYDQVLKKYYAEKQ